MIAFVWWGWGRERGTSYDREYEQEPPTETQAALVPGLLAQGGTPGSLEFTATLFDLIRRGRYRSSPVTTERKIWGGLKTQQVADLEFSLGDVEAPVEAFEAPVAQVVDAIVAEAPERLSLFRDRIEEDRTGNSERFTAFKSAVGAEISGRKWFLNTGLAILLGAAVFFALVGGLTLVWGIQSFNSVAPTWNSIVKIALGACGLVNAAALVMAAFNRRLWRRRSPAAQAEAERWEAFRRYLTDFPRLDIAPAATLELWERLLVYGIAFGMAERVLQGAQLHMPEALAHASTLYWIGPYGDLGIGPDVDEHRRPRRRLRLGSCSPLLRLGRIRRRLLGRRRRRRRRWRRRRLVAAGYRVRSRRQCTLPLVLARAGEAEPLERAAPTGHVVLVGHSEHGTHTGLAQRPGDQRVGSLRREARAAGRLERRCSRSRTRPSASGRPRKPASPITLPGLALDEHPDPELLVARVRAPPAPGGDRPGLACGQSGGSIAPSNCAASCSIAAVGQPRPLRATGAAPVGPSRSRVPVTSRRSAAGASARRARSHRRRRR